MINHNVTYLLSSEIPALRNGAYRPMPFRAATPPPKLIDDEKLDQELILGLQKNPAVRSRSNSYVSSSSNVAGSQRRDADIKEELDI